METVIVLSPFLFVIFMETLSRKFTVALRCELLYPDDLVVIAETGEVKNVKS